MVTGSIVEVGATVGIDAGQRRGPLAAHLLVRNQTGTAAVVTAQQAYALPHVGSCLLDPWRNILIRPRKPMPRYYFHFRDGSSIFKDEVGEVFANATLALQHAKRIAHELARGGEPASASIIVVEGGRQLFAIPLSEHGN